MFIRLEKRVINLNDISMDDIQNICLEIAYHAPKTKKAFSDGKVKSKYIKKLDALSKQLYSSKYSDKNVDLDKIFKQYDKLLGRYVTLKPNMDIKLVSQRNDTIAQIEETEGRGNISNLRRLYSKAKENTYKHKEYEDKRRKDQEEYEKNKESVLERNKAEEKAELARKQEENIRKDREGFYASVNAKTKQDQFRAELKSNILLQERKGMEDGKTFREIEESTKVDKKRLSEISGKEPYDD